MMHCNVGINNLRICFNKGKGHSRMVMPFARAKTNLFRKTLKMQCMRNLSFISNLNLL